jgi:hypothetical protein
MAIADALACLESTPDGEAAQFAVNYCIDCMILSTYVLTRSGKAFHVHMESDHFGDESSVATVESCTGFALEQNGVRCESPALLYSCVEER